jgi:hypothetical protein
MLFEELSEKFGCQVVEPFKEPVVIVDSKDFRKEWREPLEKEGCKILLSDYLGRSCFLIRKPQASNNSAGEQPQPNVVTTVTTSPQNIEEPIIQLIKEGKNFKEIRQNLSLTHAQLMGYMSSLRKKGILNSVGWIPQRKRKASTREAKVEPTEPSLKASNLPLREMLEASLKLLDSHPRIARFLLEKCVEALT